MKLPDAVEAPRRAPPRRALDAVVEDDPPDRGDDVFAPPPVGRYFATVLQLDDLVVPGQLGLLRGAEHVGAAPRGSPRPELVAELVRLRPVRQVVGAEDHVLRRRRQRRAVRGRQDVVLRQHQDPGLRLRLGAEAAGGPPSGRRRSRR